MKSSIEFVEYDFIDVFRDLESRIKCGVVTIITRGVYIFGMCIVGFRHVDNRRSQYM